MKPVKKHMDPNADNMLWWHYINAWCAFMVMDAWETTGYRR